jgi:hypothetical protein
MKILPMLRVAAALPIALACGAAGASDAALAKLAECMKLKAATPEQQGCLKQVEALRQKPAPKMAAASVAAPRPKSATPGAAPAQPPKVIPVPMEVKSAAQQVGLAGGPSVAGLGGVAVGNIQGLDLETAMMAVQSQRANLLESQVRGQLDAISTRNSDISKLNELLGELKRLRPAGTDPEKWGNLGADAKAGRDMYARLQAAGVTFPSGGDKVDEPGSGIYDARQKTFDTWTGQIKGKIDSLNSSQQMDMLRMQSLTNKRNEAFDLMTNFIKKMADSRSSVLGNMR